MIGLFGAALAATWGDTDWGMSVEQVLSAVPGSEQVQMVDYYYDLPNKARREWKKAHTPAQRKAQTMFHVNPVEVEFMVWDLWCDGKRDEVYKYRTSIQMVALVDPNRPDPPEHYLTKRRGIEGVQTRFCFLEEKLTEVRTDYPTMTSDGLRELLAELHSRYGDPDKSGARRTKKLDGVRWTGFVTYTYDRGQLVVSVPFTDDRPDAVTVHYRRKPKE